MISAQKNRLVISNLNKLLVIGCVTLLIIGGAFFVLNTIFKNFQTTLHSEVERHSRVMKQNSLLGKLVVTVESDIREIGVYFHQPEKLSEINHDLLASFDLLRDGLSKGLTFDDQDKLLKNVSQYRKNLNAFLDYNLSISKIHVQLTDRNQEFLSLLNEVEVETGRLMVGSTLAGVDLKGLQQVYSFIPYCREQILMASSYLENSMYAGDFDVLPEVEDQSSEANSIIAVITTLEQTLYTLTSSSTAIADRTLIILGKIPDYCAQVRAMGKNIEDYRAVSQNLGVARKALLANLKTLDGTLTRQLIALPEKTDVLLTRVSQIIYSVCAAIILIYVFAWGLVRVVATQMEVAKNNAIQMKNELQKRLDEIKVLQGLLPICASCKKIRDDSGLWNKVELYIARHSEAEFSHSVCPDCAKKLYPGFIDDEGNL